MRSILHDTTLGGVDIPGGSTVVLWFGSAASTTASEPHSTIEAKAVLTTLLDRTGTFAVDPDDVPRWAESFLVRRHEHLPLVIRRSSGAAQVGRHLARVL